MEEKDINWQPDNLEDNFIKLKPLTVFDFDELYQVASDPLIWEQHPSKDRYKREVFQQYFDGGVSSKTAFIILNKPGNKIIGSTRYYDYQPEGSSIAIGFTFLSRQCWGGLYNKSCKKLLLDYAFQFVEKVYFHIGADNTRSQLAITKIGASKVAELVRGYYGQKQLHFEYLVHKKDWESK